MSLKILFSLSAVLVLVLFCSVNAEDEVVVAVVNEAVATDDSDGIYIQVKGQSGKVVISRSREGVSDESNGGEAEAEGSDESEPKDRNAITVELDSLFELDAYGNQVGKGGNVKHSINSFASQDFTVTDVTEVDPSNNQPADDESPAYSTFSFNSTLSGLSSKISIVYKIFTEDGTISNGNEVINVEAGMVKFSIKLVNWEWCSNLCGKDEEGDRIEVKILIKQRGGGQGASNGNQKFTLPNGGDIELSQKVMVDGKVVDLDDDAITAEPAKGGMSFRFLFPKFFETLDYDPIMTIPDAFLGGAIHVTVSTTLLALGVLVTRWVAQ